MKLIETKSGLRDWRKEQARTVVVPTMGALHEGHAALIRAARQLHGSDASVIVTIFVNPLQFGPNEDLERYPRTLETDLELCQSSGADAVFSPSVAEIYHPDRTVKVCETSLSTVLCGASRPGHFEGVCTVVAKLFNLVQPDDAIFGKKDYQQLAIIRRMVRDLNFPVTIHALDTVREADGLAMSSRNRYLSAAERAEAPALHAALMAAREAWAGGVTGTKRLIGVVNNHLCDKATLGRCDYVAVVDRHTLRPLDVVYDDGLIALAVFFGQTRLIDNVELIR